MTESYSLEALDLQGIDFATVHSWADNWQDSSAAFQTNWIRQHDKDGQQTLNKPVRCFAQS